VSRLGPMAIDLGALDDDQAGRVRDHLEAKTKATAALDKRIAGAELGLDGPSRKSLSDWARRDDLIEQIRLRLGNGPAANEALDDAIYAPYLTRLAGELAARTRDRKLAIPPHFDFTQVPGLSSEMQERLNAASPADLDQAGRVAGVTPAALSALHFALVRQAA